LDNGPHERGKEKLLAKGEKHLTKHQELKKKRKKKGKDGKKKDDRSLLFWGRRKEWNGS